MFNSEQNYAQTPPNSLVCFSLVEANLPKAFKLALLEFKLANLKSLFSLELIDKNSFQLLTEIINLYIKDLNLLKLNTDLFSMLIQDNYLDIQLNNLLIESLKTNPKNSHNLQMINNASSVLFNLNSPKLENFIKISICLCLTQLEPKLLSLERLIRKKSFNIFHAKNNHDNKELVDSCTNLATSLQLILDKLKTNHKIFQNLCLDNPLKNSSEVFNNLFQSNLINNLQANLSITIVSSSNQRYQNNTCLISDLISLFSLIKEFSNYLRQIIKLLNLIETNQANNSLANSESKSYAELTYIVNVIANLIISHDLYIQLLGQIEYPSLDTTNLLTTIMIIQDLNKLNDILITINDHCTNNHLPKSDTNISNHHQ